MRTAARHFCRVGDLWLHYRRLGNGPPVLLLHQTPQSSTSLEPLMQMLAASCTAIAVDTPGFGLSDPLGDARWSMHQLADVMVRFLDELRLEQVALCGQHTGAAIAAEMARRYPERITSLALDGLPVFSPEEQRTILPHQLYRFQPQVDGTHLMWAWSRFRDGWLFFPWSQRERARRRDLDFPDAEIIHRLQVMELLRSRERHLNIYPAVFEWPGAEVVSALGQPVWVGTTADDQLFPHLDRLGNPPANVCVERLPRGDRAAVWHAQTRWVLAHLPPRSAPSDSGALPPDGNSARWRAVVGGLTVEGRHLDLPGPGHLLVHGAGSSGRCEWQRWRAGHVGASSLGPVWTIDLPGHGDSDGDVLNPPDAAQHMDDAINQLGIAPGDVHARGYGAAVAMSWVLGTSRSSGASAWVRQASFHLHEVILRNDAERSRWRSQYALPILPQWDGSHLIRLWHEIRDRELFHPWFERGRANIRPVEPQLDAESLTESVFAALCCRDWVGAHRYWLDWDPLGAFGIRAARATGAAVHLLAEPGDGWAHCLAELAP